MEKSVSSLSPLTVFQAECAAGLGMTLSFSLFFSLG